MDTRYKEEKAARELIDAIDNKDIDKFKLCLENKDLNLNTSCLYATGIGNGYKPEMTPLLAAVKVKNVKMIRLLLKAGASVNYPETVQGHTPLYCAARLCHDEIGKNIIKILIEAGAKPAISKRYLKEQYEENNKHRASGKEQWLRVINAEKDFFIDECVKQHKNKQKNQTKSLKKALNNFDDLRETKLAEHYESEDKAQAAAKDIADVSFSALTNNIRFLQDNRNKLPIKLDALKDVLLDWANLLNVLELEQMTVEQLTLMEQVAHANRQLVAAFGDKNIQRIVTNFKNDPVSVTATPCLFAGNKKQVTEKESDKQKLDAKQDQTYQARLDINASFNV